MQVLDWLNVSPGPKGPSRFWLAERLAPGDVMDDGALYLGEYEAVTQIAGCALVTHDQAIAASYYGWMQSGLRIWHNGQPVTQIFRNDPRCNTI